MINKEYLRNALTYEEYRQLGKDLVNTGKTTGNDQSEAKVAFSKLNEARMHRIDKTFQLNEEDLAALKQIKKPMYWVVISEHWCGDSAASLPIINKLAEANKKIHFRILFRDENPELMEAYASNGSHAIPKLILLDEAMNELGQWGARPAGAQAFMDEWKKKQDRPKDEVNEDIQRWYLQDKGRSITAEILGLLANQGNVSS